MQFYDANLNGKMRKYTVLMFVAAFVVCLLGFGLNVYADFVEARELGDKFLTVFWTNLGVRATAQIASFLVCFLLFYISRILQEAFLPLRSLLYIACRLL